MPAGMPFSIGDDVIFAGGVETAGARRIHLARQAIGADHQRLAVLVMRRRSTTRR